MSRHFCNHVLYLSEVSWLGWPWLRLQLSKQYPRLCHLGQQRMSELLKNGGGYSVHILFGKTLVWSSSLFRAQPLLRFMFCIAEFFPLLVPLSSSRVRPDKAVRRGLLPPPPSSGGCLGVAASNRERRDGGGLQVRRPFSIHSWSKPKSR